MMNTAMYKVYNSPWLTLPFCTQHHLLQLGTRDPQLCPWHRRRTSSLPPPSTTTSSVQAKFLDWSVDKKKNAIQSVKKCVRDFSRSVKWNWAEEKVTNQFFLFVRPKFFFLLFFGQSVFLFFICWMTSAQSCWSIVQTGEFSNRYYVHTACGRRTLVYRAP